MIPQADQDETTPPGGTAGSDTPLPGSPAVAEPPPAPPAAPEAASGAPATQAALSARVKWLSARVDASLELVAAKRLRFQKYASRIQLSTIFLSGAISFCLGLDLAGARTEAGLKAAAFVFGILVTLLNALEPYFNFRALWIEHEEAKYRFHRLRDRMDFYLAGLNDEPIDPNVVQEFHATYHDIWDSVSREWLSQRRQSDRREG